jgi:orotidine-5'-phosphate decarboxylase
MRNGDRIIVALDCSPEEARVLAKQLRGSARWLKVGMTLFYAVGPSIVQEFKELGFKVFVDLKLHDIPHQVRGAAASVVQAGADMLTVHGSGGLAMLKAAAEGAGEAYSQRAGTSEKPITLAITVLTSLDENALRQIGIERPLSDQVAAIALLAQQAGLSGVVASPQEAEALRNLLGPDAAIVTPGVRPKNSAKDDQARIATPAQALADGASYLVIGRPITAAPNPVTAFNEIAASIAD